MSEPEVGLALTPAERAAHEADGLSLAEAVRGLVVTDAASFTEAGAFLRDVILTRKRRIRETFRPRIAQAHDLHKGLLADEARFLEPVEVAEAAVRAELVRFETAEAARRAEGERVARLERERQEAEAVEAAAAENRRLVREAESRVLAEAARLEALGDRGAAERLVREPVVPLVVVAPAPIFAPTAPPPPVATAAGVSFRDEWGFEITNLGLVPREYLMLDEKKLGAVVRALKGSTAIPGVRAVPRRVSTVRTR